MTDVRIHRCVDVLSGLGMALYRLLGGIASGREGTIRKILVVKPDHLGDVILSTAAIEAIKAADPSVVIWYLAKRWSRPILEHHPGIDRLLTFDAPWCCHSFEPSFTWLQVLSLASALRRENFDAVLSMQEDPRTHLFAALCGAPMRIGFAPRSGGAFLSHPLPLPAPGEHAVVSARRIASVLGVEAVGVMPRIYVLDEERERARRVLEPWGLSEKPFGVLHIGAGHPGRVASIRCLAGIVASARERLGVEFAVIAGPREAERLESVREMAGTSRLVALPSLELRDMAAIISEARVFVGHDTGPTHLSAALGTPTVALFGPSSPERWGPVGERTAVVRKLVCEIPCGSRPRCVPCRCMEAIEARDVLDACRRVLDGG